MYGCLHTAIAADIHTRFVCAPRHSHLHSRISTSLIIYISILWNICRSVCFARTVPHLSCTNTVSLSCVYIHIPALPRRSPGSRAGPGRVPMATAGAAPAAGAGRAAPCGSGVGTLAEVSVTRLRHVCLASMSGQRTQSVIKTIIRQVGLECAAQGQSHSETLVAFMVSAAGSVQGLGQLRLSGVTWAWKCLGFQLPAVRNFKWAFSDSIGS